jgi:hypothetical protein
LFIDACRAESDKLAAADGFAGQVILQPGPRDPSWERPVRNPIFYATFKGDKAYGKSDQPSFYSQALLKAFSGWGADDEDGTWRVTTNRLGDALENAVARKAAEFDRLTQLATADGMAKIYLHHLSGDPTVPIYVKSAPPLAPICNANLTYGVSGGAMKPAPPDGRCVADWEIEAPVGTYDFAGSFQTGERCEAKGVSIRPPYKPITARKVP